MKAAAPGLSAAGHAESAYWEKPAASARLPSAQEPAERPCGGTNKGKCEVDKDKDCAWTLIYRRLEKLGALDNIRKIFPPKNYHAQTHPSRMIHEAYKKD